MLDDGKSTSINDRSVSGMLSSVDDIPLVSKSDERDMEAGGSCITVKSERVPGSQM